MPVRLHTIFLFLLLLCTVAGCGSDDKAEPTPAKNVTGRWDLQTWESTNYDESGNVATYVKTVGKPDEYYDFKADKTFIYKSETLGEIGGTYTLTDKTMIMGYQRGTFAGFHDITTFTSTQLVLTSGKQQAGTRSNVQVLTLIKH